MVEKDKKEPMAETRVEAVEVPTISVPEQVRGKYFPDGKTKKGTRWFYIVLLIAVLAGVVALVISNVRQFFEGTL